MDIINTLIDIFSINQTLIVIVENPAYAQELSKNVYPISDAEKPRIIPIAKIGI